MQVNFVEDRFAPDSCLSGPPLVLQPLDLIPIVPDRGEEGLRRKGRTPE